MIGPAPSAVPTDLRVLRVRAAVVDRTPVDARERRSVRTFLAGLDDMARPFDEAAHTTHVTASAIVVSARGTLLHRHKRLGRWLQPGGHVNDGEDPEDAALREAAEETGLTVWHQRGTPTLVHVDVHAGGRGHTHLDLRYLVEAAPDDPRPPRGESPDVAWFWWDDAAAIADDGLRGALVALRPVPPP